MRSRAKTQGVIPNLPAPPRTGLLSGLLAVLPVLPAMACVADYDIFAADAEDEESEGEQDSAGSGDDTTTEDPGPFLHVARALPGFGYGDRLVISKADAVANTCTFVVMANQASFPGPPPPSLFPSIEAPESWVVQDIRVTDGPSDCASLPPIPPPEAGLQASSASGWIDWNIVDDLVFPCELGVDVQINFPESPFSPDDVGLLAPDLPVQKCTPS